jgi:hypothetical protein
MKLINAGRREDYVAMNAARTPEQGREARGEPAVELINRVM